MNALGLAPDLTDEDVVDAMRQLPGYLDITTDDFRALYRLAFEHAMDRLVGGLRAKDLMRAERTALRAGLTLAEACATMADRGLKGMPVVDGERQVIGILSEADILHRLGAVTFLDLMLRPAERQADALRLMRRVTVESVMTRPPVILSEDADVGAMLRAFRSHMGRQMPVVDRVGKLVGVLARKDLIAACPLNLETAASRPSGAS
ncbi:MAG: CBS domain-containing protein [Pseudomonadota bacterium]|nr:CBS domain-containing protein [Pseudomonadota bacterium]